MPHDMRHESELLKPRQRSTASSVGCFLVARSVIIDWRVSHCGRIELLAVVRNTSCSENKLASLLDKALCTYSFLIRFEQCLTLDRALVCWLLDSYRGRKKHVRLIAEHCEYPSSPTSRSAAELYPQRIFRASAGCCCWS